MRLLACLHLLVACVCPATAAGGSFIRPLEDVGLPIWCDWGHDWDEHCYTDNTYATPTGQSP